MLKALRAAYFECINNKIENSEIKNIHSQYHNLCVMLKVYNLVKRTVV